jgi:hypothetical protein
MELKIKNFAVSFPNGISNEAQSIMSMVSVININPLPVLCKALLHGQKDRVFFSGHLIYGTY